MSREQFMCESVIRALKNGLVPYQGIGRIAVGREAELQQIQRDLAFVKQGGACVRFLSGDYGVGKTFLCSMIREEAWQENFVVSVVDLGRDAPLHKFEVIYNKIVEGMRTNHFREVPAFEFIIQEWLFKLEKEIQQSLGLNPVKPEHQTQIAAAMERKIDEHLGNVRIYDTSFANAFRGYYLASQQNNQLVATAALGWLKGDPNVPASLRKEFNIRGAVDKDNAFQFLQAISSLLLGIGYTGLVIVFDEAELIRGISRSDSRNAAYENIRLLMDKTAHNELKHHFFIFAGTEDFFNDELRGIPSYQALYDRVKMERGKRKMKDLRHPLIPLEGFDQKRLIIVAQKVRQVHGIAYNWQPFEKVTDALIEEFVAETVRRFGEKIKIIPRGFLKAFVDILDMIEQHPELDPAQVIRSAEHADTIEAIEREEAHLTETAP